MNPLELYEAYSAVYAPQEVDEEQLDEISDRKVNAVGRARQANVDKSMSSNEYISDAPGSTQKLATNISKMNRFKHLKKQRDQRKEEFDIFDVVLEFLYVEGYAETLEEAEWMMANIIDEEAIAIVLGEDDLDEADSLAAMQARREKRQKANMKKHGTPGFDYSKPPSGKKGYLDAITKKEEYVDEAITSEKGKAKAAEMIAKRTTASGRAKPGQGDNVATIKHIRRSNRDGLGGTPPNRKVAGSNWPKSYTGIGGRGNKAARRAGTYKEEFELWVNELVEEGYNLSDYTWDDMFDIYEAEKPFPYEKVTAQQKKHTAAGRYGNMMKMGLSKRRAKEAEKTGGSQQDAGKGWYHAKEEYVDESQHARENPEKYEREQAKKSAPVRGERTPMPPRGDKRREDFEKWYAKNVR
jgi:hypothetical protein